MNVFHVLNMATKCLNPSLQIGYVSFLLSNFCLSLIAQTWYMLFFSLFTYVRSLFQLQLLLKLLGFNESPKETRVGWWIFGGIKSYLSIQIMTWLCGISGHQLLFHVITVEILFPWLKQWPHTLRSGFVGGRSNWMWTFAVWQKQRSSLTTTRSENFFPNITSNISLEENV